MSGGDAREGTTDDPKCRNCQDDKECNCDVDEITKFPEFPGQVHFREDVYQLINGEREYQIKKWKHYDDSKWAINDWVVFIKRYLKEINDWTGHPREQMDAMRKVAALAVACIEFNNTRPRVVNGFKKE